MKKYFKKALLISLIAALVAGCLAPAALALGGNKTFSQDAVVNTDQAGVPYDNIVIKSGVTVSVAEDKALDTWQSLTLEPGAKLVGPGKLIFRNGAKCEGLEVCFLNVRNEIAPLPFAFSKLWDIFSMPALWVEWQSGHWVIKDRLPPEYDGSAAQGPNAGNVGGGNAGRPIAEVSADQLHHLGLLQGNGTNADGSIDYNLKAKPTRVEAMVMLIRLLGKEEAAKSGSWSHPFKDVPGWADPYIGYAYENGLTSGVSATQFGTGDATAAMYVTFVLRAMGYSDADGDFAWDDPFALARSLSALTGDVNTQTFLRADMIVFSFKSLYGKCKDGQMFSEKLIADGVFTEALFREAEKLD